MRTVADINVDYIFKQMFTLKQPHELTEVERDRLTKNMRLTPEVLTREYFVRAANRMGIAYEELFFIAHQKLTIFAPIVLTDFYVQDGINGFMGEDHIFNYAENKRKLVMEMEQGDFDLAFCQIDKRGRHMAYFKLFHRIPIDKRFDLFRFNLDSPGREYFFLKEEIGEILSYRQYSEEWNSSIKQLICDHGERDYYTVYQPDFGIYAPMCHDFLWKLNKHDALKASHMMGTNGNVKKRMVHISKVIHYNNGDGSIEALPEHALHVKKSVTA